MKDVFVKLRTFEVISAIEDDLHKKMGAGFSKKRAPHKSVAVLLALKDLGLIDERR